METVGTSGEQGFDLQTGNIWIYPINYPVRDYQFNIVRQCLWKNTLVVLPTGLGKTFIAAVVMFNYYRWYPSGKILFMAPTKPLVAQQIEACYQIMGIPREDTAEMTGTMPPGERRKAWKSKRVFFLTPQVLVNDLSRGVLPAEHIKCLVIDEAHKALGNYAYCQVVREIKETNSCFRVLALSATPGSDIKAVQQVLDNLLISHVELRGEESIDLQAYTHERIVEKVVVPLSEELKGIQKSYLQMLTFKVNKLKSLRVLYAKDPASLSKFMVLKAREAFRQNPPPNMQRSQFGSVEADFSLLMSLYHGYELLQLHGSRTLLSFLESLLTGEKGFGKTKAELTGNQYFMAILQQLRRMINGQPSDDGRVFTYGHPKLEKLVKIVLDHFNKFKADGLSTRIMIFSQYRDSVEEIGAALNKHSPLVRSMSFIGQSNGITQKEQLKVMAQFRQGEYNTLVSTCVGEEGLDIGDVDLIVCYDASKSPIRLVQRMGRTGRKRQGRIVMLVTQGKEEQIYQQSQYNKKKIFNAIMNSAKSLKFYPNNPTMIPNQMKPECHKMHITVDKSAQPPTNKKSLKTVTTTSTVTRSSERTTKKKTSKSKDGYLTKEEQSYFDKHYKLENHEGSIDTSQAHDKTEIFYLSKQEDVSEEKCQQLTRGANWLPWQNRPQETHLISHSDRTQHLVELAEFLDVQGLVSDEDGYSIEMKRYLRMDDVIKTVPSKADISVHFTKRKENSNVDLSTIESSRGSESDEDLPVLADIMAGRNSESTVGDRSDSTNKSSRITETFESDCKLSTTSHTAEHEKNVEYCNPSCVADKARESGFEWEANKKLSKHFQEVIDCDSTGQERSKCGNAEDSSASGQDSSCELLHPVKEVNEITSVENPFVLQNRIEQKDNLSPENTSGLLGIRERTPNMIPPAPSPDTIGLTLERYYNKHDKKPIDILQLIDKWHEEKFGDESVQESHHQTIHETDREQSESVTHRRVRKTSTTVHNLSIHGRTLNKDDLQACMEESFNTPEPVQKCAVIKNCAENTTTLEGFDARNKQISSKSFNKPKEFDTTQLSLTQALICMEESLNQSRLQLDMTTSKLHEVKKGVSASVAQDETTVCTFGGEWNANTFTAAKPSSDCVNDKAFTTSVETTDVTKGADNSYAADSDSDADGDTSAIFDLGIEFDDLDIIPPSPEHTQSSATGVLRGGLGKRFSQKESKENSPCDIKTVAENPSTSEKLNNVMRGGFGKPFSKNETKENFACNLETITEKLSRCEKVYNVRAKNIEESPCLNFKAPNRTSVMETSTPLSKGHTTRLPTQSPIVRATNVGSVHKHSNITLDFDNAENVQGTKNVNQSIIQSDKSLRNARELDKNLLSSSVMLEFEESFTSSQQFPLHPVLPTHQQYTDNVSSQPNKNQESKILTDSIAADFDESLTYVSQKNGNPVTKKDLHNSTAQTTHTFAADESSVLQVRRRQAKRPHVLSHSSATETSASTSRSGSKDETYESKISELSAAAQKPTEIKNPLSESDDDDLWFAKPRSAAPKSNVKLKSKKKRRFAAEFVESQAVRSGDEHSSDESEHGNQDCYEQSFVNDNTQFTQHVSNDDMHAIYLRSVRSPPVRGRVPLRYGVGRDIDVFSQTVREEDLEDYEHDSFCVGSEFEESSYFEESVRVLPGKRRRGKETPVKGMAQNHPSKRQKQEVGGRRVQRFSSSSDEDVERLYTQKPT